MAFKITKKTAGIIFIFTAIAVGLAIILYFIFRDECDPNRNGFTKKGKPSKKCKVDDPKDTNTIPPSGTQWIKDDSFPLKKGMWGSKVKAFQKALIDKYGASILLVYKDDGRFGNETENAVKSKLGKSEVSKEDYDKFVNPSSQIKGAYAKYDGAMIRDKEGNEVRKAKKDEWIGTVSGTDDSGNRYELDGIYYVDKVFVYLIG